MPLGGSFTSTSNPASGEAEETMTAERRDARD